MESITCEYCKTVLTNKYILKTHLKTSKKCLELRGLSLDTEFKCDGCKAIFLSHGVLASHQTVCRDYIKLHYEKILERQHEDYQKQLQRQQVELEKDHQTQIERIKSEHLEELTTLKSTISRLELRSEIFEQQLQESQDRLYKILQTTPVLVDSASKTVNKLRTILSSTHTFDRFNSDKMLKIFKENYKPDMFNKGLKKFTEIICMTLIESENKYMAICTDPSRFKFKMMDSNGNIIEDINAIKLLETISPSIHPVMKEIYNNIINDFDEEYKKEKRNGDEKAFDKFMEKRKKIDLINVEYTFFSKPSENRPFLLEFSNALYQKI